MKVPGYLDSILAGVTIPSARSLLIDTVTGLPTVPLLIESLKDAAAEYQRLGIMLIHTDPLERLELEYGWELVDKLLGEIPVFLDMISSEYPPLKLFTIQRLPGDNFLLLAYSEDPASPLQSEQLMQVSQDVTGRLSDYLAGKVSPAIVPFTRIFSGSCMLHYNSGIRFERLISRAINKALHAAIHQEQVVRQVHVDQLHDVVSNRKISIVYQPIMKLDQDQEVLGFEALSRGPAGTLFDKSDFLFQLAGECGLLNQLENLCQVQLLRSLEAQTAKPLIFVNLEPSFLEHHRYESLALFHSGIDPGMFVLEITERIAINDHRSISGALKDLRDRGFKIAVDDVGSGYSSLQSIAYLKPDFIKINDKMVQGIATDFIKQEIVRSLRDLASRLSAVLIAEGIEEETDLQTLMQLKVPFGQGYLLKMPSESLLR